MCKISPFIFTILIVRLGILPIHYVLLCVFSNFSFWVWNNAQPHLSWTFLCSSQWIPLWILYPPLTCSYLSNFPSWAKMGHTPGGSLSTPPTDLAWPAAQSTVLPLCPGQLPLLLDAPSQTLAQRGEGGPQGSSSLTGPSVVPQFISLPGALKSLWLLGTSRYTAPLRCPITCGPPPKRLNFHMFHLFTLQYHLIYFLKRTVSQPLLL